MAELWRYPVKSLRGERLQVADVEPDGVAGDRLVHVRRQSGRVVTSRFRPGLLGLQGSLGEDGKPRIDRLSWDTAGARRAGAGRGRPGAELLRFTAPITADEGPYTHARC